MATRKVLTLISLSIILLTACEASNQIANKNEMDKFIWNIQLAGYDFQHYDNKGEANYTNFINEFDKFPWIEQLEIRNKISDGSSPTLSVKDLKNNRDFWVSIAGDKDKYVYLVGYVYPREAKGFFGLGKPKTKRWCEIYLTENSSNVKDYFKLFFDRHFQDLENEIKRLEKYDELEAQN